MGTSIVHVPIPFGKTFQNVSVPQKNVVGICRTKAMPAAPDPHVLVERALLESIERSSIPDKARAGARACIAITDRTRSTPHALLLPPLIDHLNRLGIPDERIGIVIGLGMHAPDSPQAIVDNVGPAVAGRVPILNNQPDNQALMVTMGRTSRGTPVEIHQLFAEADIKIGTGNVNPCMLAGWSGGGKIVLPGVASRRCIYENHKLFPTDLKALCCSSLMGVMPPANSVRADLEEAATISGIDLTINTVLDFERRLVSILCGEHVVIHRQAVEHMRPYVEVCLPQKVDILIAGVGEIGYEVSLFQGGSRVCGGVDRYLNDGGTLIMVNQCREGIYEGFEHAQFRDWMRQMPTPAELAHLTETMQIGGEKSCVLYTFSWLLRHKRCRIMLVAEGMTSEEIREVHLEPADNVQIALDKALRDYGGDATVGIMPYGGLVLPVLND